MEVTYYFDVGHGSFWTDIANAFDGGLATFAHTSTDGGYLSGNSTTCGGSDLGTITKVEIRVYAYGDGDDRIDISFGLEPTTPEYQITPGSSEGWTVYVDVTDDPNVNGWTWAKIADLLAEAFCRLYAEFAKVAKGNTLYCAMVEIRVTYTPPSVYPYRRRTLKGTGPYSGRRGFDETTGHRRGFWP